jgi:TusE/DsrC/DsvC family sulfur relay protein
MQVLTLENKKIEIDEDGYLVHFEEWSEPVAQVLAAEHRIEELTPQRISMLKFVRWYYQTYNFFPIIRAICKNVHEPKDCIEENFINPLIAWKIAGLPRPDEPVISLLEAGQSPG